MICCKIIADYNNESGSFQTLLELLANYGDVRWEQGSLFFADVSGESNERKIRNIVKKAGYTKCYIDVYDKNNTPHETDDSVNSWLMNKLLQLSYYDLENKSQKLYKEISVGLDALDKQVDEILKEEREKISSKEDG